MHVAAEQQGVSTRAPFGNHWSAPLTNQRIQLGARLEPHALQAIGYLARLFEQRRPIRSARNATRSAPRPSPATRLQPGEQYLQCRRRVAAGRAINATKSARVSFAVKSSSRRSRAPRQVSGWSSASPRHIPLEASGGAWTASIRRLPKPERRGTFGRYRSFLVEIGRLLNGRGWVSRLAVQPLPHQRPVALHVLHVQAQLHGEPVGVLPASVRERTSAMIGNNRLRLHLACGVFSAGRRSARRRGNQSAGQPLDGALPARRVASHEFVGVLASRESRDSSRIHLLLEAHDAFG